MIWPWRRRDQNRFPNDEFGDQLYRNYQNGQADQQLAVVYVIQFNEESAANGFAEQLAKMDIMNAIDYLEPDPGDTDAWDVEAQVKVPFDHAQVKANVERMLKLARGYRPHSTWWILGTFDPNWQD